MKIQYRIKQIGDKFYPQYKKYLFWHNISFPRYGNSDYRINQKRNYPYFRDGLYYIENIIYYSSDYIGARRLIDNYIDSKNIELYKGHEIIKNYNEWGSIIYIDCSITTSSYLHCPLYPIFSRDLNKLKLKIDEIEKMKEVSKIRKIYTYNEN